MDCSFSCILDEGNCPRAKHVPSSLTPVLDARIAMRTVRTIAKAAVTVALVLGAACTYFPLDLHLGKAGVVAIILVFVLLASLPLPAYMHSALYVFAASSIAIAFGHASAATGSFLSQWPSNWPDPFSSLVFTLSLFSAVAGSSTFFANVRPATAVSDNLPSFSSIPWE